MRNYSAIADATADEWRAVLGVNLIGAANYCRAALPALRRSGRASIVNVLLLLRAYRPQGHGDLRREQGGDHLAHAHARA
jgi:NAD(P)-dependent dehydrogenase (short-subunit alcohol dehydrogenase family)